MIISNSGATCDLTPHEAGIKLSRNVKEGGSITNVIGDDMATKYFVNMHVSKCNNKSKVVNELVIKNVIIVPYVKYNLFSISNRLK